MNQQMDSSRSTAAVRAALKAVELEVDDIATSGAFDLVRLHQRIDSLVERLDLSA